MSTIMIKLKQTNYLGIFLMIIMILWQGYDLYQGRMMGMNPDTYFYTKVISNVIPGTIIKSQDQETSMVNRVLNGLSDMDLTSYKSIIGRNIPLINYQVALSSEEDYNTLTGFKRPKKELFPKINEDYFDKQDELLITHFEKPIDLGKAITKEQLQDNSYVTSKLINFDANLNQNNEAIKQLDIPRLAEKQFNIDTQTGGPKVIIFHTHPRERFAGEEPSGGGVVDIGAYLTEILETQYGVETMHCTSRFEATDANKAKDDYGRMQIEIKEILKNNPTIEVAIDIHRDSTGGDQGFSQEVYGKQTAKLMFVNGFSKIRKQGILTPIENLQNPYLEDNIALSLQMHLKGNEKYPGLMRKNLIKPYRYSLHMKPKSLLVEVGNQNNTKEEALNSMEVFAEIIMDVIEKD